MPILASLCRPGCKAAAKMRYKAPTILHNRNTQ